MGKYNLNFDTVNLVVEESINFSEVLEKLGIPRRGNNMKTLKNFMISNDIDFSHFTGRARHYKTPSATKASDYFNENAHISSFKLKKKLIDEGYKENRCEICGCSEWNEKPLNCQLHHINGNPNDNRLENLQILCPNCHTQTDTYANCKREKHHYYCPDCGKEISKKSSHCSVCSKKYIKSVMPSKDVLIKDFEELKTFCAVGRKYGVSDNAVRRWCKKYNI